MLSFFKRHIFLIIVIVAIVFMYLAAGLAIVFLRPTPGSEELTAYRLNLPNHISVKMKNLSVSTTVINLGIWNIGFGFQAALWSLKKRNRRFAP